MARSTMSTRFVARDTQVAQLMAAVERAAVGQPTAVLLGADAGVGKTRLLERMAELVVARGGTALTTHCVDLGEIGLPYLPFAEALSQLRSTGAAQLRDAVDRTVESRPALARLLPDAAAAAPSVEDEASRLQLFDGIGAVLAAAGSPGAPLVLVIEDLHWADSSSRDVLRFLLARLRTEHLLIVASYRTDDLHRRHPLRPVLAELARHARVERLDLPPFTDAELREFTTAIAGHPLPEEQLRRVSERSEGNAYFAEELLEAGADAVALPGSLADVLRARLEQLDPAVQRLADIASVAGRRVTEPLLCAVVEATGADASGVRGELAGRDGFDAALREAVTHHVLVGEDGRIAFRHALLAEAVYADLLPGEQVSLHRAYLRALTADPSLGTAAQLAHHALSAQDTATALVASRAAARDAAAVLAPVEELRHLETVLRLWDTVPDAATALGEDRVDVTTAAAVAASSAGQDERAVALSRGAVAATAEDPARQARLRTMLARHLLGVERIHDAAAEVERALAEMPDDAPVEDRAWALATHARTSLNLDLDDQARTSAEAAVAVARTGDTAGAEADALTTLAILEANDSERAGELLGTARDRARAAGDLVTELRITYNVASNRYYAGRLVEAAEVTRQGLERARVAGLAWSGFGIELGLFSELVQYALGDLGPPDPLVQAGPGSIGAAALEAARLYAAVARGDADAVARGRALEPQWERDGMVALLAGGTTIDALTWAGDLNGAVELALTLLDHLGRAWSDYFLGGIWLSALALSALADDARQLRLLGNDASAKVALGDQLITRAVTTAQRGRPRGGKLGPEGVAWLARAHAEHSRLTGVNDPELWRVATEEFSYGYRYEEARSRWRWAEALLEAGDRDAARAQAETAGLEAQVMGAVPLATAVRDLARRGRLDLSGVRAAGPEVLTAREAEVLALVARGLTNRQIGEQLFISGKTVSVHVSNVLAKLGASGRAEAVAIAHRRGLIGAGTAATP